MEARQNPNLTNCKDCGREISKRADKCPHCGAPTEIVSQEGEKEKPITVYNPQQDRFLTRNRGCLEILVWIIFGIVILFLIRACLGG